MILGDETRSGANIRQLWTPPLFVVIRANNGEARFHFE
jgi:hypothetical protein